jgi:uncharacterized protein (TIGR00304 family)
LVDQTIVNIGIGLVFVGIIIGIIAFFLTFRKTGQNNNVRAKGGAVLIIGPFPIVFGSDKETTRILLSLAIVLVLVLILFYLVQLFL